MIPETVILDTQRRVYEHKDNVAKWELSVKEAEKECESRRNSLAYAKRQLVETLEFLETHNSDCHEDWFAELGVDRPKPQPKDERKEV